MTGGQVCGSFHSNEDKKVKQQELLWKVAFSFLEHFLSTMKSKNKEFPESESKGWLTELGRLKYIGQNLSPNLAAHSSPNATHRGTLFPSIKVSQVQIQMQIP